MFGLVSVQQHGALMPLEWWTMSVVWAVQGSRLDDWCLPKFILAMVVIGLAKRVLSQRQGGGPLFAGAVQQRHKCHGILCMKNSHYENFDFLVYWCKVKSKEFQSQCKCKRVHQWPCLQILLDVLGKPSCSRFGRNGSKHCFSFTTCCFNWAKQILAHTYFVFQLRANTLRPVRYLRTHAWVIWIEHHIS